LSKGTSGARRVATVRRRKALARSKSRLAPAKRVIAAKAQAARTHAALAEQLRDPARFARTFLGHDLWPTQVEILRALVSSPRVAVKACHSSSKTRTAAEAVLWWITRYADGIALTTAPTFVQVKQVLWGEIRRAALGAHLAYPRPNLTELRLGPNNYALGLSTNQGVRFQGFHSSHLLVVIDEAVGVDGEIWEAIEGARAGGEVRVLALANPTLPVGPFYAAFTHQRAGWTTFTIDAFATPNLAGVTLERLLAMDEDELAQAARPYLVTRRWVREKYYEWGERSPMWQARVRARFPHQSQNSLIALAALERARAAPAAGALGAPPCGDDQALYAGVDVAGPGEDETVVVVRDRRGAIVELRSSASADARGEVVAVLAKYKARLKEVNVDAVGIGYNFALHLQDLGYPVNFVNVGLPARDTEKFANLKAELYWGLKMRFEADEVRALDDETALSQLASLTYRHNPRGQIAIETKEQARKRGLRSPDRAEALMLAFAGLTPPIFALYEQMLEKDRTRANDAQRPPAASAAPCEPSPPAEPVLPGEQNPLFDLYSGTLKKLRERLD
jgi:phage terminase large subunit